MRVTLQLDADDVARFRAALARAEARVASLEPGDIIDGAKHALDHLPIASAPGYVRGRIADVQRLIVMMEDEDWLLPPAFQRSVLRALAYFADPEDLVPDEIGVIGLLDDAIVLDLLVRELRGMLRAYAAFAEFRSDSLASAHDRDSPRDEAGKRLHRSRTLAACRRKLLSRLRAPSGHPAFPR